MVECTCWPEWASDMFDPAFPSTYYWNCTMWCINMFKLNIKFVPIQIFCGIIQIIQFIDIQIILFEHTAWHPLQLIKDLCVAVLLTQPEICWEHGLKGTVSFLGLLRGQNLSPGVPNNDKDTLTVELTMTVPAWTGPYPKWVKIYGLFLKLSVVQQSRCELMPTLKKIHR